MMARCLLGNNSFQATLRAKLLFFLWLIVIDNVILFLAQHMDSLGENLERSNLYLKLFKLVFGSVTLFAQENELMLKVT